MNGDVEDMGDGLYSLEVDLSGDNILAEAIRYGARAAAAEHIETHKVLLDDCEDCDCVRWVATLPPEKEWDA